MAGWTNRQICHIKVFKLKLKPRKMCICGLYAGQWQLIFHLLCVLLIYLWGSYYIGSIKQNILDEKIGNFIYDKGIIMLSGRKVDFSVILYAREFPTELNVSFMQARRLTRMSSKSISLVARPTLRIVNLLLHSSIFSRNSSVQVPGASTEFFKIIGQYNN